MKPITYIKQKIPSKLNERPTGPISKSDYAIIKVLMDQDTHLLPKQIHEQTVKDPNIKTVSQSNAYDRCKVLRDNHGILDYKRRKGFKLNLEKRYFPLHLFFFGLAMFSIGTAIMQNIPLALSGALLSITILIDWILGLTH